MDNFSEFLFTVTSTADCKNGVSIIARWPLNSALVHRHESVATFCTENGLSYNYCTWIEKYRTEF